MVLKLGDVTLPDASIINTMSARRLAQSVALEKKNCNFRHAVMCGEQEFGLCEFARTTDHSYEKS